MGLFQSLLRSQVLSIEIAVGKRLHLRINLSMEFLIVRVIGWEVVVIARFDAVFEQDKCFRHDPIELRDVNEYVSDVLR